MNGRPASRQGLRKPLRQHYARSAEASTPRTTFVDGEQVLSAWMAENAFVSWVMRERPWDLEDDLIRELDLPSNLQGNRRNRIMKFNDQDRQCFVTPPRSEGSIAMGTEMLRGVYTERSECAQHDRT